MARTQQGVVNAAPECEMILLAISYVLGTYDIANIAERQCASWIGGPETVRHS